MAVNDPIVASLLQQAITRLERLAAGDTPLDVQLEVQAVSNSLKSLLEEPVDLCERCGKPATSFRSKKVKYACYRQGICQACYDERADED